MINHVDQSIARIYFQHLTEDTKNQREERKRRREMREFVTTQWLNATPQEQATMLPDGVNVCVTMRRKGLTEARLRKFVKENPHLKTDLQPLFDELQWDLAKPYLKITVKEERKGTVIP